jgi:hypothetical protein
VVAVNVRARPSVGNQPTQERHMDTFDLNRNKRDGIWSYNLEKSFSFGELRTIVEPRKWLGEILEGISKSPLKTV